MSVENLPVSDPAFCLCLTWLISLTDRYMDTLIHLSSLCVWDDINLVLLTETRAPQTVTDLLNVKESRGRGMQESRSHVCFRLLQTLQIQLMWRLWTTGQYAGQVISRFARWQRKRSARGWCDNSMLSVATGSPDSALDFQSLSLEACHWSRTVLILSWLRVFFFLILWGPLNNNLQPLSLQRLFTWSVFPKESFERSRINAWQSSCGQLLDLWTIATLQLLAQGKIKLWLLWLSQCCDRIERRSREMTSNLLAALKSNQGKTSTTAVYPLIEAAKSGQVEGCSKALEDKKVKVDQKDPEGVNALMHAASGGYIQVVQFLVDKGARISAKDDMGETALMKACTLDSNSRDSSERLKTFKTNSVWNLFPKSKSWTSLR